MVKRKSNLTKLIKLIFFIFGAFLLFFLIKRIGFQEIIKIISKVKISFLIYGFLAYLLLMFTRAFKWFLLIRTIGHKVKYKELLPFYFINCLMSNITPLKSGEAATPLILKKYLKIPVGQGFSVIILDRLFDLIIFTSIFTLAAICLIKAVAANGLILSVFKWALIGFILLIFFLIVIITSPKISLKIIRAFNPLKKYFLVKKFLEFVEKELKIFYNSLSLFKNKKVYQFMIPLTLVCWFFEFFSFYLIFKSIMLAPFFHVAAAQVIAIAATLITFIPGGLGVGELGVVYILNLLNYSIVLSTAGAFLARIILTGTLLVVGMVGAVMLKEKIE